jgi:alpha-amylase
MHLALVFHNHQPVGQLPWAFEDVWKHSYAPFLKVLDAHPEVPVTLHYTGPLLDWLVRRRPATIKCLQRLVERGQIELLGGGMYEPILATWPRPDQDAQLQRLSDRVHEVFGVRPRGLWLAERVWEPALAEVIAANDLEFTFVDSTVFHNAARPAGSTYGAFQVAYNAASIRVFPIDERLRGVIPWHDAGATLNYLQEVAAQHGDTALAVFADDGEKFGGWPGTYDFIFTRRWLDKFFTALEKNADWLTVTTPSKYLEDVPTTRTIDLPAGSYAEMQAWSNGNWRHFLDRYAESRDMYDAVQHASRQVRAALQKTTARPSQQKALQNAYEHVLRAQSNDAYWHGTFGGLYLRHLRQSNYSEIARAQLLLHGSKPYVCAERLENGVVLLENENQRLRLRPAGGELFEWTSKRARHNLLATLRRHHERYHAPWAVVDWHGRGALLDHFLRDDTSAEAFGQARYGEQGDFVSELWQFTLTQEAESASVLATRQGGVWQESTFLPLEISKRLTLRAGSEALEIDYSFRNLSARPLPLWWGHEWNLALSAWSLPERHYHADDHTNQLSLEETAQFDIVTNPIVADRWLQLWAEWEFGAGSPTMWHLPLYTYSEKEGGDVEKSYQQSCFLFGRRFTLAPQDVLSFAFRAVLTAKRAL